MIKFIGKYTQLLKMGFSFKRLYAHNYICYTTYDNKNPDPIWIWRKGNCVELNDFYNNSYLILEYLISIDWKIEDGENYTLLGYINREEKTFEKYNYEVHQYPCTKEYSKKWYKKYKEVLLSRVVIFKLKELYDVGFIQIEN
jgi:hypothetical protein